jgi:hypothetical protein
MQIRDAFGSFASRTVAPLSMQNILSPRADASPFSLDPLRSRSRRAHQRTAPRSPSFSKPTSSPTRDPSIPFDAKPEEREDRRRSGGAEVREEVGGALEELARRRILPPAAELVRWQRRGGPGWRSVGEVGLRKHRPRPPTLAPSVCLRLRSDVGDPSLHRALTKH